MKVREGGLWGIAGRVVRDDHRNHEVAFSATCRGRAEVAFPAPWRNDSPQPVSVAILPPIVPRRPISSTIWGIGLAS